MSLLTAMQTSDRANFGNLEILIADDNPQALQILYQVLTGFGAKKLHRVQNGAEALAVVRSQEIDLVISDANMPELDGFEFVRLLRREALEKNRFIPAILLTGHTRMSDVIRARDCGASFTIAKPITPAIILQRLFWCALEERMFVETSTYVGPDRRFKRVGPPAGRKGRRSDDPEESPAEPTALNGSADAQSLQKGSQ